MLGLQTGQVGGGSPGLPLLLPPPLRLPKEAGLPPTPARQETQGVQGAVKYPSGCGTQSAEAGGQEENQ